MTASKKIKKYYIKHCALFILTSCLLFSNRCFSQEDYPVLVAGSNSTITKLESRDIRRIFLGLSPINITTATTPIINLSNQESYKLFLKNILFLTERGYKRKILKRMFRQGADKINSLESEKKLIELLNENPDNISFMLRSDAENNNDIKIIQALW